MVSSPASRLPDMSDADSVGVESVYEESDYSLNSSPDEDEPDINRADQDDNPTVENVAEKQGRRHYTVAYK